MASDRPDDLSWPVRLRVWGPAACFTRPEFKVERVSYEVMTPSAARGVLEAILWKPAMRWVVERIDVLKPIRWQSVRRNEVSEKVPVSIVQRAMRGESVVLGLDVQEKRQQRASLILRDVAYTIHARIGLTAEAKPDDTLPKFYEIFVRRASSGQCFHRPCLGCREFAADFVLVPRGEPDPEPIGEAQTRSLGWLFHDYDFSKNPPAARFFDAALDHGRLAVPPPSLAEPRP